MYAFNKLSKICLWYRCILEVILVEKSSKFARNRRQSDEEEESFFHIGRKLIKEKTTPSFRDYIRKALEKINQFEKLELSDNEIDSYWIKYKDLKIRFDLMNQYKLLCAPIIEYIVLLDRLIYLHEFNSETMKHYLVKIFDGAKSPRCHALISFSPK